MFEHSSSIGVQAGKVAVIIGGAVAGLRCDVRAEDDVESLMAMAESRFGGLHIAFANAGVGTLGLITDSSAADWARVVVVNLLGPMLTVKHTARRMPDGGSIIITASLNAVRPAAGMGRVLLLQGRPGDARPGRRA
jgi:NAD(P)-dependent dehydrogenase (short-subunit alcohol dehydrogenase family)